MQQKNQTTQSTVIEQTASNDVYESLCKKINLSTINSVIDIEQFQSNERMSESSADERIAAAVSVFLKMIQDSAQKVERLDKSLLDYHIARIDEQIGRQLDEILHNETFQEVESAWRGLKFLVDRTDFRQNVKIEVLDFAVKTAQDLGVADVQKHLLVANKGAREMAQELVDYADEQGANLLVLGTHGRTGLMHLLMGSFAETVMRQSHLPLLVIRSEDEDE